MADDPIRRLLVAAKLLYANAEGCAVNHYSDDFAIHGLPGWLADCAADIQAADLALAKPSSPAGGDVDQLRADRDLDRRILNEHRDLIRRICKVIGADYDDDPVERAKGRMDEIAELDAEVDRLTKVSDAGMGVIASLAAAISLLERTPKAKKSAPSDRMFDLMIDDYRSALAQARAVFATPELDFRGLTSTQREALEWLKERRDNCPKTQQSYGFNPPSGRARLAASMRGALAQRGLVEVQRVSDRHLRYEITDAGRAALSQSTSAAEPVADVDSAYQAGIEDAMRNGLTAPAAVESAQGVKEAVLTRNDICRLWQYVVVNRPSLTVEGFTNLLLWEIDDRASLAAEKEG